MLFLIAPLFQYTEAALRTGIAAARHDFRGVIRGPAQFAPGPFSGEYFLTTLAGCLVLQSRNHSMLSCRLADERSDYRVVPASAFAYRFHAFEDMTRRGLEGYHMRIDRCEQRMGEQARTVFSRRAADPTVILRGAAAAGEYSIDLDILPPGGSRVWFTLVNSAPPPEQPDCR